MERVQLPNLDSTGGVPLYRQVKAWLLNGIRRGLWPVGSPIPSERELSDRLRISRATLRQAVDELEHEGWLVRSQGRGTFVAQPKLEQPLDRLRGFSENMRRLGVRATSRVLEARLEAADAEVAGALGLRVGEAVATVRRLRLADDRPLMVEVCHLAYEYVLGILDQDLSGSLYAVLEQQYRIRLVLGWETLEVRRADPAVTSALELPPRSDVLFTERLTRDQDGTLIEFTRRYARADRCRFRMELGGGNADFTLRERTPSVGASEPPRDA